MRNSKKYVIIIAILAVIVIVIAIVALLGNNDKGTANTQKRTTIEKTVGTDIDGDKISDKSFYGTWIADSEKAKLMFDDFKITFNEDGTYDAVITCEEISGKWVREGEKVILSDIMLDCDFTYTEKGGLKLFYEDNYVSCHR